MEIRWKSRVSGLRKRLTGSLLVFVLTLGLIAITPGLNGSAKAVDFTKTCSLTVAPVAPENTELASDLKDANVVIDLYKVADAQEVNGYDTYTYDFLEGYTELEKIYSNDPNNADWRAMAQEAASYALDHGTPVKTGAVNTEIGDLSCGLYLLIARGNDIENYRTTVKQEDGTDSIATVAHTLQYVYTYAPELISLPSKRDVDGDNTTAGNGQWLYSMEVNLKPQQSLRYGSLEIVKTLLSYEVKDPATFIFEVTAVLGGETVFRDNVSLTFDQGDNTGEKRVVLENRIPVGAEVTVEEIYSGAVYELTSSPTQTTTIEANNMVSVAFTNDYNETNRGGGSVTNHFNQTEDGWHLQQIYDDGTVVEQGE